MVKDKKGFTLIELLVVIGIISLLSSILLASLSQAKSKARDSRRIQDLQQIQVALQLYQADHNGRYPGELTPPLEVQSCPNGNSQVGKIHIDALSNINSQRLFSSNYLGKYLKTTPHDPSRPSTGFLSNVGVAGGTVPRGYWYFVSADNQNYTIAAFNTVENLASIPINLLGLNNSIIIRPSDNNDLLDGCFGS